MQKMLLAIEGGGTKTRMLLAYATGEVVASERGGPASGLYVQRDAFARETARVLKDFKQTAATLGGRVAQVGVAGPMDRDLVKRLAIETFGPTPFMEAGEGEIALAMHDLPWGVAVIAGTGASCRAINERGDQAGCGGFGPQFGDEGSGYWIGREGVTAALRVGDGRGPGTILADNVCEFFGVARVWDIFRFAEGSGHIPGPRIAAFAPYVFKAMLDNDYAAQKICRQAALTLSHLAIATARRLEWNGPTVPLVLAGGVFNAEQQIVRPFKQALAHGKTPPNTSYKVYPPVPDPSPGILKLMMAGTPSKKR